MELFIACLKAFLVGGAICCLAELLIDKTGLTPARILTLCVVLGTALGALGLYGPFAEWAGAGATAEELAVFELADAEAAGALLDALRARNAEREESYAGYLPDEVPKLQNTLLLSTGRYVLLCTAPDTAGAREAWDAAFEG